MKRIILLAAAAALLPAVDTFGANAAKTPTPPNRVVVMYFHRTQRCPTCKKMGSYSEDAVKKGFAKELAAGKVAFYYIDFQKPDNEELRDGYKISGPALVVAKIKDDKVQCWKPLAKIWELVSKKDDFYKYVQDNVHKYLKDQQKSIGPVAVRRTGNDL